MKQRDAKTTTYPERRVFVLGLFMVGMGVLAARAVELQVFQHDFLSAKAGDLHVRVVSKPAVRGIITDRRGESLAISTPVDSIWINPKDAAGMSRDQVQALAKLLGQSEGAVRERIEGFAGREFVYLKRHLPPSEAERILALKLAGVHAEREYRRYYPTGEVFSHIIGFTNIDGKGQEGVELAYDDLLKGAPGARRVIRDRLGRVISEVAMVRAVEPGKELRLTIDRRIQYLAYRELKLAVQAHNASSGSAVVMNPNTGEILAMVNQPSFNPNNRADYKTENYRNRAIKDLFEPGSTAKPFTIVAALETEKFLPTTIIDTNPGRYNVTGHTITDPKNYGRIDLSTVLSKSSNVGSSKVAMQMRSEDLWNVFQNVGFGQSTYSGLQGEASGVLRDYTQWYPLDKAALSFGYGFSVTPLQLAVAYSVLAADGVYNPVRFVTGQQTYLQPQRILKAENTRAVLRMMEEVVTPSGTGYLAAVDGYRVAGKTGTSRKAAAGGYAEDRYIAVFAGMAPAKNPQLVTVVMINDPKGKEYYGGKVAAPVFARIMSGALRQMNIPPDDLPGQRLDAIVGLRQEDA